MNRRAFRGPLLVAAGLVLGALPALAETRIEKDLKLSPGGDFRLETDMGSVTVTGSPDAGVHVVITSKRKDLEDLLTFRLRGGSGLGVHRRAQEARHLGLVLEQRRVGALRDPGAGRDAARDRHVGGQHQGLGHAPAGQARHLGRQHQRDRPDRRPRRGHVRRLDRSEGHQGPRARRDLGRRHRGGQPRRAPFTPSPPAARSSSRR